MLKLMSEIKELPKVFPALYLVHYPSGPVYCCEDHANKLKEIANIMGFHVGVEIHIGGNKECANCVNEAKSKNHE